MFGNKFSKQIKIALISILAIIVVSVIIAIINSSNSTFKTATKSTVDIENNSSTENKENEQPKHYDFLDNENSTFKFTEKEFIEKFAKTINKNVNDFSITRGANELNGYICYSFTTPSADGMSIGVKTSKQNNKVTDIAFEYFSLVNYVDDEKLTALETTIFDNINCIILGVDKEKYYSNGYSEEEKALIKDKYDKLYDCIKNNDGLSATGNYGGQGQVSNVKIKYSVIQ